MKNNFGNALSAGISWLMDDLVLIKTKEGEYKDGKVTKDSIQKYCCKGIVSNYQQQEYKQGLASRGSLKCTILNCTLSTEPCLGDKVEIKGCSPFAGETFRINDKAETSFGSAPAIQKDSLGVTYIIELVR